MNIDHRIASGSGEVLRGRYGHRLASALIGVLGLTATAVMAQDAKPQAGAGGDSLSKIGAKLSNPLSDVWALFTEFDLNWNEGNLSDGKWKEGGAMIFQPIMPFKLTKDWKLITRPTIPVPLSQPIPEGGNIDRRPLEPDPFTRIIQKNPDGTVDFSRKTGIGDITLPMLVSPNPKPGQKWSFGAGPSFVFPTATTDELGSDKWEIGPALLAVRKTPKTTIGALGQYWWSYATQGSNKPDTSHGSILYFYYYNLPAAWQIGFSPTITYNDKADGGDKWNVPLGLLVGKTTKFGKMPVKFQFGVEKSIVRQDSFGQDWQVKLNVIPVIPALVKNPLF